MDYLYCQAFYSQPHEGWSTCKAFDCEGVKDDNDEDFYLCPLDVEN